MRIPRLRLSRSPLAFWLAVAGLALVTALVVASAVGGAQSLAARYGPLRPMVVASRPVERGSTLARADVSVRDLPARFRTDGAFTSPDEVVGRTVIAPLAPGEPVLGTDLAPGGLGAVAALLPAGTRAIALPTGAASPPLRRGDVVDVLATFDPDVSDGGNPTLAVALDAPVLDVGTESATVAVSPDEARAVAFALAHGAVTVALTPGYGVGTPATQATQATQAGPSGQRRPVASSTSTTTPRATR